MKLLPIPVFDSVVASHQPHAGTGKFHDRKLQKGHLPHSHVISDDMTFDEKQRLGNHMDVYHSPVVLLRE